LQDPCWDKTEIKEELKDEVPLEEDEEHEDRLMHMDMFTQTSAYKYVWTRVTIYPSGKEDIYDVSTITNRTYQQRRGFQILI
jgi:hypothetical protein